MTKFGERKEGVTVAGHTGTWYEIDRLNGMYLMESEQWGDETACLIINENNELLMDDIWNGWEDWEERT